MIVSVCGCDTPKALQIAEAMRILDQDGDAIFARIRAAIERGDYADARRQLDFVDVMVGKGKRKEA